MLFKMFYKKYKILMNFSMIDLKEAQKVLFDAH